MTAVPIPRSPDSPADQMRAALVAARNRDGGWPYYTGKASRLEPTVFAHLALREDAAQVLAKWPRRDGLYIDAAGEINVAFNGQAALLYAAGSPDARATALARALTAARGVRIPASTINRQDNTIQAWSWTPGTFSWVESTAWCLLGLKRLTRGSRDPGVEARLADGQRFLADRVCRGGGWNDGNSNMLGTELPPYVPTTALGLMSLRDRAHEPFVASSLNYLEQQRSLEAAGPALALTRICLGVFERDASTVEPALVNEWRRSRFLDNALTIALALYALTAAPSGFEAFRV